MAGGNNENIKKDIFFKERKSKSREHKLQLSKELMADYDTLIPEFAQIDSHSNKDNHLLTTNNGGNNKSKASKLKTKQITFGCTVFEKKLIQVKAKRCRLSMSEFCRRAVFGVEIKERLSDKHIETYKTMVQLHNKLKETANTIDGKDPELSLEFYQSAREVKKMILNIIK